MAKYWKGKPPQSYEAVIGKTPGWVLYLVNRKTSWMNLKLVAADKQINKGNYVLGYNPEEDRFAGTKDYALLKAHLPELEPWVRGAALSAAGQPQKPVTAPELEPEPKPLVVDSTPLPKDPERLMAIFVRLMEEGDIPLDQPVPQAVFDKAQREYGAGTDFNPDYVNTLAELIEQEILHDEGDHTYLRPGDPHA